MANYNEYDPYSYKQILQDRQAFRQAGGTRSNDFNMADTPGLQFYRILFHFYSQATSDLLSGYGLLHPTWEVPGMEQTENLWQYSTAWSYLTMNGETERADYLKNFIYLLSNINTFSPWYWKGIKGLDAVVAKRQVGGEFKFGERAKITLECLPDAVDNRIRTLIDLYRSAVWSWRTKREIVPANLRKFDMTICLMQAPVRGIHTPKENGVQLTDVFGAATKWINFESEDYASSNPVGAHESAHHISTYKVFELHGCEFDYTMGSEAYGSLETDGFQPEYTIPIWVDDVVEYSYNEFAPQIGEYGDMVAIDANEYTYKSDATPQQALGNTTDTAVLGQQGAKNDQYNEAARKYNSSKAGSKRRDRLRKKMEDLSKDKGSTGFDFPSSDADLSARIDFNQKASLLGQGLSFLTTKISNKASKIVLGNLFGFSINRTVEAVQDLARGNVSSTIARFIESRAETKAYSGLKNENPHKKLTGLNKGDQKPYAPQNNPASGSIYEKADDIISKERTIQLGNLFQGNTIINNL